MIVHETTIPDVNDKSIDQTKVILAQNIISNISPLLDEEYANKINYKKKLKDDFKLSKRTITAEKEQIETLIKDYNRKKKVSKILDRISKLVESGLINDSQLRHETVILLKILDKLPEDKLDMQLTRTMDVLNKRFSKS
jgi:predicted transcriptional regulator